MTAAVLNGANLRLCNVRKIIRVQKIKHDPELENADILTGWKLICVCACACLLACVYTEWTIPIEILWCKTNYTFLLYFKDITIHTAMLVTLKKKKSLT